MPIFVRALPVNFNEEKKEYTTQEENVSSIKRKGLQHMTISHMAISNKLILDSRNRKIETSKLATEYPQR